MTDCYKTLGVANNATMDEIKKAYRQKAFCWHPDRNPGDKMAEDTFKKVQEAYDTLTDPNIRARYDYNHRTPKKPTKKNEKYKRPYSGDGFSFSDAPPPKVDLWGDPIQEEHKWVDTYSTQYEKDGQPDIRGL